MMFSIPFMLLTIIVYLLIPELRNQHGKSLVCYLIGLCIGYSMLCFNSLIDEYSIRNSVCKLSGNYDWLSKNFGMTPEGISISHFSFRDDRSYHKKRKNLWGKAPRLEPAGKGGILRFPMIRPIISEN